MKNRNEGDTEHNHGQRKAKIELHETHSRGIRQSRRRKECDGAGLRSHYGKADVIPRKFSVAEHIAVDVLHMAAFVNSVTYNAQ